MNNTDECPNGHENAYFEILDENGAHYICPDCGYEFPPPAFKVERTASREAILTQDYEPEWRAISRVTYARNAGRDGKLDTMRVDYWDDEGLFPIRVASEFVCVFHPMGFPREMALRWLANRCISFDNDVKELLLTGNIERRDSKKPKEPSRLLLDTRGKFAKILDYDFSQLEEVA